MKFEAEVLRDVSLDPYFKVRFSYMTETVCIKDGFSEIIRKAPASVITYDETTTEMLKNEDKSKLELELLNTIIKHLLLKGVSRIGRPRS